MSKTPSPTEANGRDGKGRFVAGNNIAKGNPHAKRIGELRSAMIESVTIDDMKAVIRQLVRAAKDGESWAVKVLLDRTLGKPLEADLIERIEQMESTIREMSHEPE